MAESDVPARRRTMYFPSDRSLGRLSLCVFREQEATWEPIGHAQGSVDIAEHDILSLDWNYFVPELTALRDLQAGDLFRLAFPKFWPGNRNSLPALSHMSGLHELRFYEPHLSFGVEETGHLRRLAGLEWLNVGKTGLADAALAFLDDLHLLRELYLYENELLNGCGFTHLANLSSLQVLDLDRTSVTDSSLEHLQALQALKRLSLRYAPITGAGLRYLTAMPSIEDLDLSDTMVDDASLEHLGALPRLRRLNLWNTRVNDQGLIHLQGLSSLENLVLDGTLVTDVGIRRLHGLAALKDLDVQHTGVTQRGVHALKQALPDCSVRMS